MAEPSHSAPEVTTPTSWRGLVARGHRVVWASAKRSAATRERAQSSSLGSIAGVVSMAVCQAVGGQAHAIKTSQSS